MRINFILHLLKVFKCFVFHIEFRVSILKSFFILFLLFSLMACEERIFDNPFDPGASKREFIVLSTLNIPFNLPRDLTWDGVTLWLIDEDTGKIYSLNKYNGSIVRSFNSPLPRATGLVYDGSGLWVSSSQRAQLVKINIVTGETLKTINIQRGQITSLAYDSQNLWGFDKSANKIYQVDPNSGQILGSINNPGFSVGGMAFFENYLWISDPNVFSIYKISSTGSLEATYSSPGQFPAGITWDGFYIWNADGNKKIYQLQY
ncbi:MAG: hypothetical protein ACE5WD_10775 [Candidatus Aminicenantia bacterium]